MVQHQRIEALRRDQRLGSDGILGMAHLDTGPPQRLFHKARKDRIVIDIEHAQHGGGGGGHGTCRTAKNRPSCRMALAKLSYSTGLVM